MTNFKQQQLIDEYLKAINEKFPEVQFISVSESPEDPADLWLNVTTPPDEDRELELLEFTGDKSTDILLDYGYQILVMPRSQEEAARMSMHSA
ncbi:MAG: hypothetical protein ACREOO_22295 [bacterium]